MLRDSDQFMSRVAFAKVVFEPIVSCDQGGIGNEVGSAPGFCKKNNGKLKRESVSAASLHLPGM